MDIEKLGRRLRREHLYQTHEASDEISATGSELEQMLPHRDPMLLLDGIEAFDHALMRVRGYRTIDSADPVLSGHFPSRPVYPGVLLLEAAGQLGLCLEWLVRNCQAGPDQAGGPIDARLLKIHHATFVAPVAPGASLTIVAASIERDELTATFASQVWHNQTLCAAAVAEVYFV